MLLHNSRKLKTNFSKLAKQTTMCPQNEYYGSLFQSSPQIRMWEIAQMYETGKKQGRKPPKKDEPIWHIKITKIFFCDV